MFVINLSNLRKPITRADIFRMTKLPTVTINGVLYRKARGKWTPDALMRD